MHHFDFPHKGREDTAKWMYFLASRYASDLGPLATIPFRQFYDFVRRIPYVSDPQALQNPNAEFVARPLYLLKNQRLSGLDCKKKGILLGAWAEANRIPWELIGMSEQADKEIHHVFPVLFDGARMVNVDATYPTDRIGAPKPGLTYAERFSR